tara:strand:- start:242 stop:487 length:246 start_codon:yes stop_codon:yes gene_type:complete
MQHYLETLNALTTDKIVNLEDYYSISLSQGVQLQGGYFPSLMEGFKNIKNGLERFETRIEDNGFITIEFKYNGDFVTITLT